MKKVDWFLFGLTFVGLIMFALGAFIREMGAPSAGVTVSLVGVACVLTYPAYRWFQTIKGIYQRS